MEDKIRTAIKLIIAILTFPLVLCAQLLLTLAIFGVFLVVWVYELDESARNETMKRMGKSLYNFWNYRAIYSL